MGRVDNGENDVTALATYPRPMPALFDFSRAKLVLLSYGVKLNAGDAKKGYRSVPEADLYVDCRCITEKGLSSRGTGTTTEFQAGVAMASGKALEAVYGLILEAIKKIPDRRSEKADPFKDPFVICFLCAWGVHRSVATKHIMGRRLRSAGYIVTIVPEPSVEEYLGYLQ